MERFEHITIHSCMCQNNIEKFIAAQEKKCNIVRTRILTVKGVECIHLQFKFLIVLLILGNKNLRLVPSS